MTVARCTRRRVTPWAAPAAACVVSLLLLACAGAVEPESPSSYEPAVVPSSWMECRAESCDDFGLEDPYELPFDPSVATLPEAFGEIAAWASDHGMGMEAMQEYLRQYHPVLAGVRAPEVSDPCETPAGRDSMMSSYETAGMSSLANQTPGEMRALECVAQ